MNRDARSFFLLTALFLLTANALHAQKTNDEFKKNLRKSLVMPELKPDMKFQSIQIQQYEKEVLKVSPDTELPTILNRIKLLKPIPHEQKIHLNLEVTNIDLKSQVARSFYEYSTGKVFAIPDSRSIQQWIQYTRGDHGTGVSFNDLDLDPVRTIQRYKAKQRKVKVDKILKAYGQEGE